MGKDLTRRSFLAIGSSAGVALANGARSGGSERGQQFERYPIQCDVHRDGKDANRQW